MSLATELQGVIFRPDAKCTGEFGIQPGYRVVDGRMIWDVVRIHQGRDRAGATAWREPSDPLHVPDPVYCPLQAERSSWWVDPKGQGYGTLLTLYIDRYGFCTRIAHMPESKLYGTALRALKRGDPISPGVMGQAGSEGDSTGAHTHTEVQSIGAYSKHVEDLLVQKYGPSCLEPYTDDEVIAAYKGLGRTDPDAILATYRKTLADKQIELCNKYLCRIIWPVTGKMVTRYSSLYALNGC